MAEAAPSDHGADNAAASFTAAAAPERNEEAHEDHVKQCDAAAEKDPEPPYKEGDDPYTGEGLQCYYKECKYHGSSWLKIIEHLRRKHGRSYASLKDSYLYKMANEERKMEYRQKQEQKAGTTRGQSSEASGVAPVVQAKARSLVDAEEATGPGEDFAWSLFWVKCDRNGDPKEPFEAVAHDPKLATENKPSSLRARGPYDRPLSQQALAPVSRKHPASSDPEVLTPRSVLQDVHGKVGSLVSQQDPTRWLHELPQVRLKASYRSMPHVPAKGESDRLRAAFPKEFQADKVLLPDFKVYLEQHLSKTGGQVTRFVDLAGRALGAFEVEGWKYYELNCAEQPQSTEIE